MVILIQLIKERLKRREEHLYNIPTENYTGSYFQEIITQLTAPASRIRITKLAPGKTIPFHVDYDVNYGVRCIVPIYGSDNVVNLFKRNKPNDDPLDLKFEILEDITFENEVEKSKTQTKDTKETKSTLTFGK